MYQKRNAQGAVLAQAVLLGCGISIVMTFLGALVAAVILEREILEESKIGYAVMFITGIAAAVGSAVARIKAEQQRWVAVLLTAAAYYIMLLLIAVVMFEGPNTGFLATSVLVLGCSMCISLINLKRKKAPYGKVRKYRNR